MPDDTAEPVLPDRGRAFVVDGAAFPGGSGAFRSGPRLRGARSTYLPADSTKTVTPTNDADLIGVRG